MNKDKITRKEKLSYSLVNLGNIPIMALINGYLLIFYTNVCGLNPAACATLFLIARIVDGLNDPLEGFIIDHLPNTKMGHFRPTLIIGSVLCSLNFLLLWFGPMLVTEGKLAIAYVSYLLIGVMFSCMDISLNSMLPVMTTDTDERNKLSAIKGISYTVGGIVVAVAAPLILGNASNREGYIKLISIFTAVIFLFSIIGTLGIKERVKPQEEKRYSFKDIFRIFTQKPVLITFITVLVASVGGNIGGTVGTYYFTYIFGDLSISSLIALATVATFLPATIIAPKFISKYGKKEMFLIVGIIGLFIPLFRLIDVRSAVIILLTTLISGSLSGLTTPINFALLADNTDYVELHLNQRTEGAIASSASFITKCAMGIGGAIPGYFLAWAGFDGQAAVQSERVNTVIIVCNIIVPIIFSMLALFIFSKYPLTKKKLAEQNELLAKKRAGESELNQY